MVLYYDIIINKLKNFIILLQFIELVIYFSKLIDICINCYESQKVVNNYFVGTKKSNTKFLKYYFFYLFNTHTSLIHASLYVFNSIKILQLYYILQNQV